MFHLVLSFRVPVLVVTEAERVVETCMCGASVNSNVIQFPLFFVTSNVL